MRMKIFSTFTSKTSILKARMKISTQKTLFKIPCTRPISNDSPIHAEAPYITRIHYNNKTNSYESPIQGKEPYIPFRL